MLKTFSGRAASQNEFELRSFIGLLQSEGVRRYCEIGSRHGDTFHEVMINLPKGSVGVANDLPGGLWGQKNTDVCLRRVERDLERRGYKASRLIGNSQGDATYDLIVGRGPYDAILIDGDHTYAGVKADWERYRGLAPMIAFHDIVGQGQHEKVTNREVEVPVLWAEIKAAGYVTREFIAPGSKMGIGVVWPATLPKTQMESQNEIQSW